MTSGGVSETWGSPLDDGHRDFENWCRNGWENWSWSWQPPFENWQKIMIDDVILKNYGAKCRFLLVKAQDGPSPIIVKTFAKLPWQLYGRWIPAETGMLRSGVNWTARLLTLGDEQGWGAPGRAVSGWVIWMGLLWAGGGKLNYIHISGNSPLRLMLAPGFMDRRLPQCNVF